MKKSLFIIGCLTMIGLGLVIAQSKSNPSPVLLKFPKENVTKAEFERVYQKNNGGYEKAAKHTPEQFREYLNLYINFKRKVFEAEAEGLDKSPAFVQEYTNYKKQLAQPYLSAKDVEDKLVSEAYDRMQYSVNAAHILIMCDENALPEDTLAAYNKVLMYRDSIVRFNKSFEDMAAKYSQDPSAKENKGNLGYFTAFEMVYPFECAVYNTPVGQVSMPVRTRFGYHILKVNDKIKNEGTKRAAHIIVRTGERYTAKDSAQAIAIINEIYQKLKNGANFAEMAKQYSDDPNTASKGGDLGSQRLRPELEDKKLKLGQGEFTEPFQTSFGWHILAITEVVKPATFEAAKPDLKRKIERDTRAQLGKQALIAKLKADNNFKLNNNSTTTFKGKLTEGFSKGTWSKAEYKDTTDFKMELYSLYDSKGKVTYTRTLQDFVDFYARTKPRYPKAPSAAAAFDMGLTAFVNESLLQFEEDRLPEKNPDYKALIKEYRDGILLFSLMEKKVWKRAVEDSVGLKAFYEKNKASFNANELVDAKEYRTSDEEVIKQVKALIAEGATQKQIDSTINTGSALRLRITTQTFEKGKNEPKVNVFSMNEKEVSDIVKDGDLYKIFIIEKKFPSGIKPFEKAKSECITKYQDYLEKTWLKELEKKYPVKVNEKTFKILYK